MATEHYHYRRLENLRDLLETLSIRISMYETLLSARYKLHDLTPEEDAAVLHDMDLIAGAIRTNLQRFDYDPEDADDTDDREGRRVGLGRHARTFGGGYTDRPAADDRDRGRGRRERAEQQEIDPHTLASVRVDGDGSI